MIQQATATHTIVTRQPDHAQAAAAMMAFLRDEFFDLGRKAMTLEATARHDDGWLEWEANARLHPDGRPLNFIELDPVEKHGLWMRGIHTVERNQGPFQAAAVSRHAQRLADERYHDVYADECDRLMALAEPEAGADEREWYLERAFRALVLGDFCSLLLCAGWDGPTEHELISEDGSRFPITLRRVADWRLSLSAWPFTVAEVRVSVSVFIIPHGGDWRPVINGDSPPEIREITLCQA